MNQLENVILRTGFDRNWNLGVVQARLFQPKIAIGIFGEHQGAFLRFPIVSAKAPSRGKLRWSNNGVTIDP
jgi:hypothetical protein